MINEVDFLLISDILKKYFPNEIPNDYNKGIYNKSIAYIENNIIKGILNYDLIYDRIEINYIVVLEQYRNHRVGSQLLEYLINNNDVKNITLEVRDNNLAAIKLYENYNFQKVAVRKQYYNNQDAIMMMRS